MSDNQLDPAHFGTAFKDFMEAVVAAATPPASPLLERIKAHLGDDLTQLSVIEESYDSFDHPNVQLAIEEYIARPGRQSELIGIGAQSKHHMNFGLSDLLAWQSIGQRLDEGAVDYVRFHLAGDRILSCVQLGLYFIHDGDTALLVLVAGHTEHGPRQKLQVEVVARRAEDTQAFLAELTESLQRVNVYRGQVISISPDRFGPGPQSIIAFHSLPRVDRENVILPEGVLERVERHTIVFAEQSERLLAAGRSLKRGLLLFGPPGVGKTLTVQYLTNRMRGRTVILTTGLGMGFLQPVVQLARSLVPSMVVLEDVDLIAQERGMPGGHAGPLLFELLNEMDGLQDDRDIIFILTTNRAEILEPALAARPGRIDLAVELPLPDAPGRRRLLELYARGLELQDVDLDSVAERIDGATPAYIKEVLRKAAVLAATEGEEKVVVKGTHLETALGELDEGGELAHRLLGLRSDSEPDDQMAAYYHAAPSGFPAHRVAVRHQRG